MNKSLKKPLYVHNSILKKIKLGKDITQIWDKSSVILPIWVEKEVLIYNGHQWKKLQVSSNMIGRKFGEFCITRIQTVHKKKKIDLKKKKKK